MGRYSLSSQLTFHQSALHSLRILSHFMFLYLLHLPLEYSRSLILHVGRNPFSAVSKPSWKVRSTSAGIKLLLPSTDYRIWHTRLKWFLCQSTFLQTANTLYFHYITKLKIKKIFYLEKYKGLYALVSVRIFLIKTS